MIRTFLVGIAFIMLIPELVAQGVIRGKVVESVSGELEALPGATVNWINTNLATSTNVKGEFELAKTKSTTKLVVSFVGYQPDTLDVKEQDKVFVVLKSSSDIDAVTVVVERSASYIDYMSARNVESIIRRRSCLKRLVVIYLRVLKLTHL